MELVTHEPCQQYFDRRIREGWKCISLEGYNAVLLSPDGTRHKFDLRDDVLTLRPNGVGYLTQIQYQEPSGGEHWEKVDEVSSDEDGTYVQQVDYAVGEKEDLYLLGDTGQTGVINWVKVWIRVRRASGSAPANSAWTNIRASGGRHRGSKIDLPDSYTNYSTQYSTNPTVGGAWTWSQVNGCEVGVVLETLDILCDARCTQVWLEVNYSPITAPTVTTQAASSVEATTATGNGNITNTGGENCDKRGIVYGLTSQGDPGGAAPPGGYDAYEEQAGSFGTGAFTRSLTGLSTGRTYYARAYAHNSAGYNYGGEVSFLTKPAAPTSVQATDGEHTNKVVVTWVKSTGATGYQVYRDDAPLGWLGDVATYDDVGADPPVITPGDADASDGLHVAHVALSLSGQSVADGTIHTYKVRAKNATGESVDSGTNTGYRKHNGLTYQWQRSEADDEVSYVNIVGATTAAYNDTEAPENGDGRYYRCVENATGAAEQTSSSDRGYRAVAGLENKSANMAAKMVAAGLI